MSRNPEEKPTYLQDVVTPKETEKAPEGFDLDREFGEGTAERMKKGLGGTIKLNLRGDALDILATHVASYRILFGENLFSENEEKQLTERFRKRLRKHGAEWPKDRDHSPFFSSSLVDSWILFGQDFLLKEDRVRLTEILKNQVLEDLGRIPSNAGTYAAHYRILSCGDRFWDKEAQESMEKVLQEIIQRRIKLEPTAAAILAAVYRILRAHDIKFIPGKGIEIIDTPPQPYQQKSIPPMPEERKF